MLFLLESPEFLLNAAGQEGRLKSQGESPAPRKPREACASRRVCGARGSARAHSLLTEGVPEAWREVSGRGAPRGRRRWAGHGGARPGEGCAAPPAAPDSRSPGRQERAAVGGACGDWRAGGEVGSTLFFMLMREWGLSVFTLRREPPPFIHPHGPSRCRRRRQTCAFAPLPALGRGRGGGDDPRSAAAARAPPPSSPRGAGGPAGRTPGLGPPVVVKRRRAGRREQEPAAGQAKMVAATSPVIIHVDLTAPVAFLRILGCKGSFLEWVSVF
ncbi:translation initiation factor IF-2-like [Cebus imitator]|uniref:translation initiation factor IF-2-like n=1 Tax=Cebus imitator TaxID=2715852 RepID=UPI001896E90A|nr:translation initiation factor IF-2-like [Cebus imitator]